MKKIVAIAAAIAASFVIACGPPSGTDAIFYIPCGDQLPPPHTEDSACVWYRRASDGVYVHGPLSSMVPGDTFILPPAHRAK